MKTSVTKMVIGLILTLEIAGIARGTIVFQDNCDQDVRTYWTDPWGGTVTNEGVKAVTWSTGKYLITNGMGTLYTKSDFAEAANGYTLSYTGLKYAQGWNDFWTVYGPGGIALKTQGSGNPAYVIYNGTQYSLTSPASGLNPSTGGLNSVTIQYEKLATDEYRVLITLTAGSWKNTSGTFLMAPPSVTLFDQTFSAAADFTTYGSNIKMTNAKWVYQSYSTEIDNITLDVVPTPEPTTLGLLVAGGLVAVVRRKRS